MSLHMRRRRFENFEARMDSRAVLENIFKNLVLTKDAIERAPAPAATTAAFVATPATVGQVGEVGVHVQLAKLP